MPTMKFNLIITALFCFYSCSAAAQPAGYGGPAAAGPSPAAPPMNSKQDAKMVSASEAKKIAEEFAAGQNWGPATSVAEHGNNYIVSFKTPQREVAILSQRAVLVNRITGVAGFQPRR